VFPLLGAKDAVAVGRKDVVELRDAMREAKKSNWLISRVLRQLGKVYNWAAYDKELVPANPCAKVKQPKTQGSTKYYTTDEVAKLLAWAAKNDPALHPIIAFAFYTGCRKGEIAAVRWSDVDWQGARIVIQRSWTRDARKSGVPVVVNMPAHLSAILAALQRRTKGEGEALVFPDPATGGMRAKHNDRGERVGKGRSGNRTGLWGLDVAIAAEKVRRFRSPWHAFRHTTATNLAINGASLTAIRDQLGQSTLHMAANYTHLAAEHVRQYVDKLPALGPVEPANVTPIDEARIPGAVTAAKGSR
jgi:integrase